MNLVTSRQIISELLLGDIISLAYVLHANVTPVILNSLPVFLLKPSILVANIIIASIVSFKLLIATLDWGPKNQKLATAIISGPSQKLLGKKTSEASLEGVTKKSVRFSNRAPKIYWTDFRQDGKSGPVCLRFLQGLKTSTHPIEIKDSLDSLDSLDAPKPV